MSRRRLGAWAGMVGPLLFVAVFTIEGWLRPGYDWRGMFVSELALGPRGWIQSLNFLLFGTLFVLFAFGVAAEFREGKASSAGPILLAIIGVSLLASAFLPTDPNTTPRDQMSQVGRLHQFFGALVFSLSPVSCFVFWRRFRADPRWRGLSGWTLAAGAVFAGAIILQAAGPAQPPATNAFNQWQGAMQRTALITYCAWVFTVGVALWRNSRSDKAL